MAQSVIGAKSRSQAMKIMRKRLKKDGMVIPKNESQKTTAKKSVCGIWESQNEKKIM